MRILVVLPFYDQVPPTGAYVTTREYVQHLVAAGHAVDVVTTGKGHGEPRTEGGVRVWPLRYWRRAVQVARPEVLISHHRDRRGRQIVAQAPDVPRLLMVHGMSDDRDLGQPGMAWFPSHACRAHYSAYRGPFVVLPPPIAPERYRTEPGELVTLNGSTTAKGADVLALVAERMPDTRFLVVRSHRRDEPPMPGNVEVIDRTDPRQVYARTRVLVMPSQSESYGRAGVEAMLSGIPVLASPLPGLREALGEAATYIERDDIARWADELRRLSAPAAYRAASKAALAHTESLDSAASLCGFEEACVSLLRAQPTGHQQRRPSPEPVVASSAGPPPAADVVAWVHYGVPYRRAGSETMLHTMMRALREAGTSVLVVCSEMPEAPARWDVDGVPYAQLGEAAAEATIRQMRPRSLVTHHHFGARAVTLAKTLRSRAVLLLHNDFEQPALELAPDLCVYNTEWVMKSLATRYPQLDQAGALVVHPPVIPEEHRVPRPGTHVTLVNLSRDKGVDTWHGAAAMLGSLPFLGVTGAHGKQVTRGVRGNVRIIPQTSDMRRDVWARTRVLTAPSVYESYGMAAVEALASGIPVIAHPTLGLREALGDAGVFIDRSDTRAWVAAIRALYRDGPERARKVEAARARSAFLAEQSRLELARWIEVMERAASGPPRAPRGTVRRSP